MPAPQLGSQAMLPLPKPWYVLSGTQSWPNLSLLQPYSFGRHLLNTYCMPDPDLSSEQTNLLPDFSIAGQTDITSGH